MHLSAGHFGLGHGSGEHALDEYYVVEWTNPRIQGLDGPVCSFVEYLTSWRSRGEREKSTALVCFHNNT
ncbi:MAG TPA: hypothetical protein VKE24_02560 [Candidatus Acidoferrales bacterium]|nr:hypothetical protein [Candidatus Acidoferrales bacterium]